MVVTLEVSKLSGWLNADASCRESKGGHAVRGGVCGSAGGGRRTTAVQAACRREGATADWRGWGARVIAYLEHELHVRDAGGVEAQRLVER